MEGTANRKVLLSRIQVCDFVLIETHLFLDTHPTNKEALAYYSKYLAMRKEAAAQYVAAFGPLTAGEFSGGDRWTWVSDPWPWEKEA